MTKYTKQEAAAARNLLRVYKRYDWCRGEYFRDKSGSGLAEEDANGAAAVCLVGACKVADRKAAVRPGDHYGRIYSALNKATGGWRVVKWNDAPGRTKEQVLDLLREIGGLK